MYFYTVWTISLPSTLLVRVSPVRGCFTMQYKLFRLIHLVSTPFNGFPIDLVRYCHII
nr:MAG TPA: hypothetical protein [Caudoviricetes sp.]DAW31116.1 MAG TPA: hypothetical protein [Caudoviricetes sp.]